MLATRLMLEKGVDIVGAIARRPEKVGADLGELSGLQRLNVAIESDAEALLADTRPDIVMLATASFVPEVADALALCIRNEANVVTISEECLYPWSSSPRRQRSSTH